VLRGGPYSTLTIGVDLTLGSTSTRVGLNTHEMLGLSGDEYKRSVVRECVSKKFDFFDQTRFSLTSNGSSGVGI